MAAAFSCVLIVAVQDKGCARYVQQDHTELLAGLARAMTSVGVIQQYINERMHGGVEAKDHVTSIDGTVVLRM